LSKEDDDAVEQVEPFEKDSSVERIICKSDL
jgi:hypothetical protein